MSESATPAVPLHRGQDGESRRGWRRRTGGQRDRFPPTPTGANWPDPTPPAGPARRSCTCRKCSRTRQGAYASRAPMATIAPTPNRYKRDGRLQRAAHPMGLRRVRRPRAVRGPTARTRGPPQANMSVPRAQMRRMGHGVRQPPHIRHNRPRVLPWTQCIFRRCSNRGSNPGPARPIRSRVLVCRVSRSSRPTPDGRTYAECRSTSAGS